MLADSLGECPSRQRERRVWQGWRRVIQRAEQMRRKMRVWAVGHFSRMMKKQGKDALKEGEEEGEGEGAAEEDV